ncbi:T-box transcription factor TBX21-like [Dromiciops gliroides]|uniref:T-box transcription factor TBX21-like n=1 Tax=Dromiciops gliroides TaxID=33562 RepID=UPI001CC478A1|nr:T-box transcription factor TBX21-like [Dromiciops gliroides]
MVMEDRFLFSGESIPGAGVSGLDGNNWFEAGKDLRVPGIIPRPTIPAACSLKALAAPGTPRLPARFQEAQGYQGTGGTLDLNHLQRSPSLASFEMNIPIQASDACSGTSISGKLKVVLHNYSLWLKFYREQTEMILNKQGRRMFPFLVYKIYGMDPVAQYRLFLEIQPVDQHHWRFQNCKWSQCERTEDAMPGNQLYMHPDSPNTGAYWMMQEITFEKLKMTNNKEVTNNGNKMILLQSLHKYQPRLVIEEVRDGEHERLAPSAFTHSFIFPETEFIAVTAYQNSKISQLKISYNPFAKGFRESYYPEESRCLASVESTAMTTISPETGSGACLPELGEGSCQAKEGAPLNPGLLGQAAQPLLDHACDSTPSSSNLPSLGMSGMEQGFLPCTSAPTTHHNSRQDAVAPQMYWPLSSSSNSNENSGRWLQSVPPVPVNIVPRTEEENQLEKELWIYDLTSHSNNSGLGKEGLKKRGCILGDGPLLNFLLGLWVLRLQVSKDPMVSIHGNNNLQPLDTNGMNAGVPSFGSPTMPFGPRQDVVDTAGALPTFSSTNSSMNSGSWPQSVTPEPMDIFMGAQRKMSPKDQQLLAEISAEFSLDTRWVEDFERNFL